MGGAPEAAGMTEVADCDAPGGRPGPVAEPSSMTVCASSAAWKARPHWWEKRTLAGLSALQLGHTIAGYLGITLMKGGIRLLCDSEGRGATWSGTGKSAARTAERVSANRKREIPKLF